MQPCFNKLFKSYVNSETNDMSNSLIFSNDIKIAKAAWNERNAGVLK
jgi:hypothetical protein